MFRAAKRILQHLLEFVDRVNASLLNRRLFCVIELSRCEQTAARESRSTVWAIQEVAMIRNKDFEVLLAVGSVARPANESVGIGRNRDIEGKLFRHANPCLQRTPKVSRLPRLISQCVRSPSAICCYLWSTGLYIPIRFSFIDIAFRMSCASSP